MDNIVGYVKRKLAGKITINGKEFVGKSVSVYGDGTISVDGNVVSSSVKVSIVVHGDAEEVKTTSGNVTCNDVGRGVKTTSGDITCRNVSGNVSTTSGDVTCDDVLGDVSTVSGDIRR